MNIEKNELTLEALEQVSGGGKDTLILTTHSWRQMHVWGEVTPHRLTFSIAAHSGTFAGPK